MGRRNVQLAREPEQLSISSLWGVPAGGILTALFAMELGFIPQRQQSHVKNVTAKAGCLVPPAAAMGKGTSSNEFPVFGRERRIARDRTLREAPWEQVVVGELV